jgi:malate synthase
MSHKRGILAIGGMAAQIPIKMVCNSIALEKVRKTRARGEKWPMAWVASALR